MNRAERRRRDRLGGPPPPMARELYYTPVPDLTIAPATCGACGNSTNSLAYAVSIFLKWCLPGEQPKEGEGVEPNGVCLACKERIAADPSACGEGILRSMFQRQGVLHLFPKTTWTARAEFRRLPSLGVQV